MFFMIFFPSKTQSVFLYYLYLSCSFSLLYSVMVSAPFLPSVYWKHKQYVFRSVPEPGFETGSSDCFSLLLCLFASTPEGGYLKCHRQDQLHNLWDLCKMKMQGLFFEKQGRKCCLREENNKFLSLKLFHSYETQWSSCNTSVTIPTQKMQKKKRPLVLYFI